MKNKILQRINGIVSSVIKSLIHSNSHEKISGKYGVPPQRTHKNEEEDIIEKYGVPPHLLDE